jgi:hypothetical protein
MLEVDIVAAQRTGGAVMNRTMCLIVVGFCIAGMVLIAGCTQETPPETTPTPTVELPTGVPNITYAGETPTGEIIAEQTVYRT